jgi:hypothetical protein
VEFITREEWDAEEEALLEDLTQQDGRAILHCNQESHAYTSWCKMYSVYGEAYTRSRVPDPSGATGPDGRTRYVSLYVDELRAKLKKERRITGALGTTRKFGAEDARSFRRAVEAYVDSSNEAGAMSFWPLVRRVRMSGRSWNLLKSGCVLVDAPGVNDDNSARDGIVKSYLKDADSVWIVSNIKRAVNDRTAKDMLGESFRRQLLMDGQYGALLFIATQSDVLVASEIADNLKLSRSSPVSTLAAARNAFTRERIQKDFIDGLAEMSAAGGEKVDRAALAARFQLPVFCVSSMDFQKLTKVRTRDGPPQVWSRAEETELPALQRFVHEATLRRRTVIVTRHADALSTFCRGMEDYLQSDGTADGAKRAAAKAAFDGCSKDLGAVLKIKQKEFYNTLKESVSSSIVPTLKTGAKAATTECSSTARAWSGKWSRGAAAAAAAARAPPPACIGLHTRRACAERAHGS